MNWKPVFDQGLSYTNFLEAHGSQSHRERWEHVYNQVVLTSDQQALLKGFTRQMNVLCIAGAWCGDCVNQCPIFPRFAEGTDRIHLRFIDRDKHIDVQEQLSLCAGHRVPVVVFLSEDNYECGRYGDRTISKYRDMARTQLGAACPTGIGGVEQELLSAVTADWLNEFERIQLMLRMSPRLRAKYGD